MNHVVAAAARPVTGSAHFLLHPFEKVYLASFRIHPQVPPLPRQPPTLYKMFLSHVNVLHTWQFLANWLLQKQER